MVMFGCLAFFALSIAVAALVGVASGRGSLGMLVGSGTLFVGYVAMAVLGAFVSVAATRRHSRLMQSWGVRHGRGPVTFRASVAFITPPELHWWESWAAYDLWVEDAGGHKEHFHVFITGACECLFRLQMTVTPDSGYVTVSSSDFDGRRLSDVPVEELLRKMEEKKRKADLPQSNTPEV